MSQIYRLPFGARINRSRPISFQFNGKRFTGFAGDTLASALLANGVSIIGASFKYRRPRGIFAAGQEDPNAFVTLVNDGQSIPNVNATTVELADGMSAYSSSPVRPLLNWAMEAATPFLGPGFYYKTFKRPRWAWSFYDSILRRAASSAPLPSGETTDIHYHQRFVHTDVLVVGAGVAGLSAAYAAAACGADVVLVDENAAIGGTTSQHSFDISSSLQHRWIEEIFAKLQALPNFVFMPRTTVVAYHDHNFLIAIERHKNSGSAVAVERLLKIRATRVVLAVGATERHLVFADNDKPGVMLAASLRTYISEYGVLPGHKVVVFTNNNNAYLTAICAANSGAQVAVVDLRESPEGELVTQARNFGISLYQGSAVTAVLGKNSIRAVEIQKISADGLTVYGPRRRIDCSLLAVSGGWIPNVHLFSQSRGQLAFDKNIGAHVPGGAFPLNNNLCAGACNGTFSAGASVSEGLRAGLEAATFQGFPSCQPQIEDWPRSDCAEVPVRILSFVPCEHLPGEGPKKHFVDLCNDVTVADIFLAQREGFDNVELLKRYTALGMGIDQGRTSNLNGLTILANNTDTDPKKIGHTTYRPNAVSVSFGAIAGYKTGTLFAPQRLTPIHAWHIENGAIFEDTGTWIRPFCFPRNGETAQDAVQREAFTARTAVGLLDASTLGKIELRGPDAAAFLDLMYVTSRAGIGLNRCRYGQMANESGILIDDGVTTKLGDNHFLISTNSSNSVRIKRWLEEWLQTELPHLRVFCTCVTDQWANATLVGPRARTVLSRLTTIDLDRSAFPFMSMQNANVGGIPARIFRIAYSGDLSYEINVPARYGLELWRAVLAAGKDIGICAYGTEAMHLLRAEKGFVVIGQDTDRTVSPLDLGINVPLHGDRDFVGRRSLLRSDMQRNNRKQLVGILSDDIDLVLPVGTHLMEEPCHSFPAPNLGHVTSGYQSPNLGRSIALALIEKGRNRVGTKLFALLPHRGCVPVTVTAPCFFDASGDRRHA